MPRGSFDRKLILVYSFLGTMAVMVGLAAIGVNWYLTRSHGRLIQQNLPVVQLAGSVGSEARLIGQLAAAFVQADTAQDLANLTESLTLSLARIERGVDQLEQLNRYPGTRVDSADIAELVARMSQNARRVLELDAQIAGRLSAQGDIGARFDLLLEAQLDLARLKLTSGIADIYSLPQPGIRSGLDVLADRHFFAFDRLTELVRSADTVRRALQEVPKLSAPGQINAERDRIRRELALIARRLPYLPTAAGQTEALSLIDAQRAAFGRDGVFELRRLQLQARAEINRDNDMLQKQVAALSASAQQSREAVMAQVTSQISRTTRISTQLSVGLLLLVTACAIAGALAWRNLRRDIISRLHDVSRRIVAIAGGDYTRPVPLTGHDEIGRMEKALNILRRRAADAEALRATLEKAVLERTGDVVREMQASDVARAEAEAANRGKSDFLARMSHEIRTPLNGVIGMLGLLETEEKDAEKRQRIAVALGSARDLLEISNDILTLASNENHTVRGKEVHFDARVLAGQLGQYLRSLAAPAKLAADVDFSDNVPPVLVGDVVKIRQIVTNLLSNAVKYTQEGSVSLTIDYARDADTGRSAATFVVSDTGIGMSDEALSGVFDLYARADHARRAGIEGVGLGLPIARQLTEAIGGVLTAESQPGLGSRFSLTVPLWPGDADKIEPPEGPGPGGDFGLAVLVVDDHAVNRIVARGYLERLGCTVAEAATGKAALEAARASAFDLIVIDLDLPDMDGATLAAQLGAMPTCPPLAALTAYSVEDTGQERARLGVARVLSKPISPRALTELLSDLLKPADGVADENVRAAIRGDMLDLGAETTGQIVGELISDVANAIPAIISAPPDARRKLAHRLKGAALNFGLGELCARLAEIENRDGVASRAELDVLRQTADRAVGTLAAAAREAGLQTDPGSTNR